jgi:hypothetical protein
LVTSLKAGDEPTEVAGLIIAARASREHEPEVEAAPRRCRRHEAGEHSGIVRRSDRFICSIHHASNLDAVRRGLRSMSGGSPATSITILSVIYHPAPAIRKATSTNGR